MKNIFFTATFIISCFLGFSQGTDINFTNTDRQKIDTLYLSGSTLHIKVENDIERTIDLSGLSGFSLSNDALFAVPSASVAPSTSATKTYVDTELAAKDEASEIASQVDVPGILDGPTDVDSGLGQLAGVVAGIVIDGSANEITANYVLTASELNRITQNETADSLTVTIPQNIGAIGDVFIFSQGVAGGRITPLAGANVTFRNTYQTDNQVGAYLKYRKVGANEWMADIPLAVQYTLAAAPTNIPVLATVGAKSEAATVTSLNVSHLQADLSTPVYANNRQLFIHGYSYSDITIATPSGWTLVHNETVADDSGTGTGTHFIFTRLWQTGDSTADVVLSFPETANSIVAVMSGWDNVSTVTPYVNLTDNTHTTYDTTTATGTGIPIPSLTTTTVNSLAVAFVGFGDTRNVSQAPVNYSTEGYRQGTSLGADAEVTNWYVQMAAIGTVAADALYYDQIAKTGEAVVVQLNGN